MPSKTHLFLIAVLFAIGFLILTLEKFFNSLGAKVEVTNPPHETKSLMPWYLGFTLIVFGAYFLYTHPDLWQGFEVDLIEIHSSSGSGSASVGGQNIYDTDPFNNRYIIGPLSGRQFKQFNRVLKYDQTYGRPNDTLLQSLAQNDPEVIAAYYRFLKCKYLMRTSNQVVYPK